MVALTAYFETAPGTPLTGPAGVNIPEVTIVDDTDAVTQVAIDGTELANQPGVYLFDFTTFVAGREYSVRWNGGPLVPVAVRFQTATVSGDDLVNSTEVLPRLLGLDLENAVLDNQVYDSNGDMTSARLRVFANAAAANAATKGAADGADSEVYRYTIDAEYSAALKADLFRKVRAL